MHLKTKCATFLVSLFKKIFFAPHLAQKQPPRPRKSKNTAYWNLPNLFSKPISHTILPFGYQDLGKEPDPQRPCDKEGCRSQSRMEKSFSCGHSFHLACLSPTNDFCPVCREYLLSKIKEKASIAREAIFDQAPVTEDQNEENETGFEETDRDVEHEVDDMTEETAREASAELINSITHWATAE